MTKTPPIEERTARILLLKPTEWPVGVQRAAGEVITVPMLRARRMVVSERSARYAPEGDWGHDARSAEVARAGIPESDMMDLGALGVAEVLASAEGYSSTQLRQLLEAERAGKNRKTLVAGLEQLINA